MTTAHAPITPRYALTDHHGRAVSEATFRSSHQLIFFGFTHCRGVCPRALSKLSVVLERLGPVADRIQPLYISVDPERDTPEVMRAFLQDAYPRFLGLTGTQAACEDARAAFRVFAGHGPDPDDAEGYAVPHTAITYLLDTEANYLAHFPDVIDAEQLETRLRALVP